MELVIVVVLAVAVVAAVWLLHPARAEARRLKEQEAGHAEKVSALESELGERRNEASAAKVEAAEHKAKAEALAKAEGIANEVMKQSGENFLKRVDEKLEGQRKLDSAAADKQKAEIDGIVAPVKENLKKVEDQINKMEATRQGAYEGLGNQVEALLKQTGSLNNILQSNSRRGEWAEQQLENILELADMGRHIDYATQVTSDDGKTRPDVVVSIPNGAKIAIDSKFPLVVKEEDLELPKKEVRKSYAKKISKHFKDLDQKGYAEAVDGPLDFVVMFIPSAPILDEAMAAEPGLWQEAWKNHRVLIATPEMLVSLLRTIAISWERDEMSKDAQQILDGARELYKRLGPYLRQVSNVGKGIEAAMSAYNASLGSLQRRVLPEARKFEKYGLDTVEALPHLEELTQQPRSLDVPEAIDAEANES